MFRGRSVPCALRCASPFGDRWRDALEHDGTDGGGDQIHFSDQVHNLIADAADGIDAGDGVHLLILTDDVNLIAMTGIQGIKYGLIDIGKRQFDARVGQQFTDKATSDITCAKM
ncbi:Uncharacterised protein [Klebsiella pneumoniae]|nr:Uncharacterised protein [Klebsiella pneumoniae]